MDVPRNSPCPCGSGKKYKDCCFQKNYSTFPATKQKVKFTISDNIIIDQEITDINSIPPHNKNGIQPNISQLQMIDLCLDEIYKNLSNQKVGMLVDLVNSAVAEMDIVPVFTYNNIADHPGFPDNCNDEAAIKL